MNLDENIQADKEIKKIQDDVKDLLSKVELNVYIAKEIESIYGILDYPFRLISADKLVNRSKEGIFTLKNSAIKNIYRSQKIILDSGGTHPDITNEIILEVANELQPNYIVPKDYPGLDKPTIESVKRFFEIKDSYLKYDPECILIPLQKPYRIVQEFMNKSDYFAIGGVVGMNNDKKKRIFETILRKYPQKLFHLFGVAPMAMADITKRNKNVLSIDFAIANKVIFSGEVAMGEFSRLPERMYYLYFIVNELVTYLNYEPPSAKQHSIFSFTPDMEKPVVDVLPEVVIEEKKAIFMTAEERVKQIQKNFDEEDW